MSDEPPVVVVTVEYMDVEGPGIFQISTRGRPRDVELYALSWLPDGATFMDVEVQAAEGDEPLSFVHTEDSDE